MLMVKHNGLMYLIVENYKMAIDSKTTLVEYVKRRLGDGVVDINVSDEQIYVEYRDPNNRDSDQTEDVKLVVEF